MRLQPLVFASVEGMLRRVYHRLESRTQTPEDARLQEQSQELWGRPARGSDILKVKAWTGPLPSGVRGIEFTTDVPPQRGCPPTRGCWIGPRPGVRVEGGYAKIRIQVTRNTQTMER